MSIVDSIFMRMFGRPQGMLGRFGGIIMARMNQEFTYSVIDLLDIQPNDRVLEIGFGSGMGIQRLAELASTGYIAGLSWHQQDILQVSITQKKWSSKLQLEIDRRSRVVWSIYGKVRWKACPLKTAPSIKHWRLTPCKSGQMPRSDCGKCGES